MSQLRRSPEEIRLPRGFSFSAVAAGIKASGRPDLALAVASLGTTAAARFTSNRVVAAPLEVGRGSLAETGGRVRAVIVNSGNANCATGKPGLKACQSVCAETAKLLSIPTVEVFPSSTGIIGVSLPAQKIIAGLPELIAAQDAGQRAVLDFAHAIMTTDTRPKLASARVQTGPAEITLLGVGKGAGMIHPQLATMLVYIFTDVSATSRQLQHLLNEATEPTFNCMSIDGDTSTNDTVLLLASGQSGARVASSRVRRRFIAALTAVCQSLAEQIISDGEGVQHVVRLTVEHARTREEALHIARVIAHSALVKTAWAGADPNWGRILAAVGRSGLPIDPARVRIFIGKQMVCRDGIAYSFDEKGAHRDLAQAVCDVRVQLGRGNSQARFLTTDLTAEYVRINADYST